MGVSISRNFGPLDELKFLTREDWGRVGRLARERIMRRTLDGRDQHDASFAPYSAAYAELKGSSRVDLQLSGEMLRAITVEPDDLGVTLSFTS